MPRFRTACTLKPSDAKGHRRSRRHAGERRRRTIDVGPKSIAWICGQRRALSISGMGRNGEISVRRPSHDGGQGAWYPQSDSKLHLGVRKSSTPNFRDLSAGDCGPCATLLRQPFVKIRSRVEPASLGVVFVCVSITTSRVVSASRS
jgi:hypothetical protein